MIAPATEGLARELRERGIADFDLAFVLGSGLGAFAEHIQDAQEVSFEELAGLPASGVPGHSGRFVLGEIGGVRVLVQSGRHHLYEGLSARDVTRAVRAFALLGCQGLVLTNAAGGLVAEWEIPCLMRIADHLNLQGRSPLNGVEAGRGNPYDVGFGEALEVGAREAGVPLRSGVYAGLLGPAYETAAEIRYLRSLGADAVGMSTVLEALTAHAVGMRVAAVSCISNQAAGISKAPLSHDEVVRAGAMIADGFCELLARATPHLAAQLG